MSEQPKSLESQLNMARPRRAEVKRVPLTTEEKEMLGEIMDKAVAAEKAGELQDALNFYTDYKNELFKIKERKSEEEKEENIKKEKKLEAAKKTLDDRPRTESANEIENNAKFILKRNIGAVDLVDIPGDLLVVNRHKRKITPAIVGMEIRTFVTESEGFNYLLFTGGTHRIGIIGDKKYLLDGFLKLLAEPADALAKIDDDIFIKIEDEVSLTAPPTTLDDIHEEFQDLFVQKKDGLYWKKAVS